MQARIKDLFLDFRKEPMQIHVQRRRRSRKRRRRRTQEDNGDEEKGKEEERRKKKAEAPDKSTGSGARPAGLPSTKDSLVGKSKASGLNLSSTGTSIEDPARSPVSTQFWNWGCPSVFAGWDTTYPTRRFHTPH